MFSKLSCGSNNIEFIFYNYTQYMLCALRSSDKQPNPYTEQKRTGLSPVQILADFNHSINHIKRKIWIRIWRLTLYRTLNIIYILSIQSTQIMYIPYG